MKLVTVAALLAACKQGAPANEAAVGEDTTAAPSTASVAAAGLEDALPSEPPAQIETRKLQIGPALEFVDAEANMREVSAAAEGEFVCLAETFQAQNRVVAASASDCSRRPRDLKWTLYAVDEPRPLLSFDRFIGYSDALGTIAVKGGVEEKTFTVEKTLPSGQTVSRTVSSAALTTFISLADGAIHHVEGDIGEDHFHFVEGRRELLVTGFEPQMVRAAGAHVGVVTGVPATRPQLTSPNPHPVSGKVTFDDKKGRFEYASHNCAQVSVSLDGTDVECDVRLSDDFRRYSDRRLSDGWLVATAHDAPPLAVHLTSGEQVRPAEGICPAPMLPHVPSDIGLPRLAMACAGEGRPAHEFTKMYLWAPNRRLEIPGGPWRSDQSFGHYLAYTSADPWAEASGRWLDLRRYVAWDVGDLYLVGRRVATNARPLARRDRTTVFSVDQAQASVRPLGELDCPRGLMLTYEDDEIISVVCKAASTGEQQYCGKTVAPVIDYAVTWDTRTGKRYRTQQPVVGATRDAIVFVDSTKMQSSQRPCEPTKLLAAAR